MFKILFKLNLQGTPVKMTEVGGNAMCGDDHKGDENVTFTS